MFLKVIRKLWEWLSKLSPENRNVIIFLLVGFIFYSLITETTKNFISNSVLSEILKNKKAENYTSKTAVEINNLIKLIAEKDKEAYDVLLLSYHNSTLSLQGYKYLYLSCLAEAPRSIDTPLLKPHWDKIDYIYYADELNKIHNQSYVLILDIDLMEKTFPKLYHLVKASNIQSLIFFTIEGQDSTIGMLIILYDKKYVHNMNPRTILPSILKLAVLLDYDNLK